MYVKFTTCGGFNFSTIIQNFGFLYYIQGPPSQDTRLHLNNKNSYLVSITKPEKKVLYYNNITIS